MPLPIPGPGRPTIWTQEIEDEILGRLAEGKKSLTRICDEDDRFPAATTVIGWYLDDRPPGFSERYLRAREVARELKAENLADRVEEMAATNAPAAQVVLKAQTWRLSVEDPSRFGRSVNVRGNLGVGGVDQLVRAAAEQAGVKLPEAELPADL